MSLSVKMSVKTVRVLALAFSLLAVMLVSACGFSPLYGPAGGRDPGSVSDRLDTVTIGSIPDESGQYLRNALIDRLYRYGRPSESRYVLNFNPIVETKSDLDITKTATSTRSQIRLNTSITLTDTQTGKVVLTRQLVAINSFNVLQSQYDTRVSEEDVRHNALDDLARQVEAQLALYFKRGDLPNPDLAPGPAVTQTP